MSRGQLPVVGLLTLALAFAINEATTARAIGLSVAPAQLAVGPWIPGTSHASIVEPGSRPQNLCADCERLREQLRIVGEKAEVFDNGLQMLRETRRELASNTGVADGIAAAYLILQSLNVAFGLATLPCSIPQQWLRGLVGGTAGLGAYVQEGDPGEATLAAVVSSLGLGVVSDAISAYEFMQRYRNESAGLNALRGDVDRTIREFDTARHALRRAGRTLESDLSRGGCPFDPLDDLLRR